jgi:hypothetical protein
MNTATRLAPVRRWLAVLTVATLLALTSVYGTVLIDEMAGTTLTAQALACQPSSNGCG